MLKRTLFSLVLLLPLSASASTVHIGDYFLKGAEKTTDDIYVIGQTATLAGTVMGDATAVSRSVFSESTIAADALFIGENVQVEGPVGDDIRVVGGEILIDGLVGDDLIAIGRNIVIGPKGKVKGSLYAVGGTVTVKGVVEGNATVVSGVLALTGVVEGDLELWGTATFGEPARIGGDFVVHSNGKIPAPVKVVITGKYIPIEMAKKGGEFGTSLVEGFFALKVLMMLSLGFALFFLARERTEDVLLETLPNFWHRALRGLLTVIVLPLVAILLLPTIVGMPIALVLGALFFLLLVLSWACAGILLGVWCERILFKRSAFPLTYRPVLLGTLFLGVVSLIPFIGPVFCAIVTLSVMGSLGTVFAFSLKVRR